MFYFMKIPNDFVKIAIIIFTVKNLFIYLFTKILRLLFVRLGVTLIIISRIVP